MTNAQIIATLTARLIRQIELFMSIEFGMNYERAKARVQHSTVAGSAVWANVDAHFKAAA